MTFNYRKGFSSLPVAITLSILLVGIAIVEHFGYSDVHSFTSEQKLAIYRDHKKFSAIQLTPQYSEFGTPTPTSYRFSLRTGEKSSGYLVEGTIGFSTIKVERKTQSVNMCPI